MNGFELVPVYDVDYLADDELVLTVYGGDTCDARQILGQTEIGVRREESFSETRWIGPKGLAFRYSSNDVLWVNVVGVSVPIALRQANSRREIYLPTPGLPMRLTEHDDITIMFQETLVCLTLKDGHA